MGPRQGSEHPAAGPPSWPKQAQASCAVTHLFPCFTSVLS